jgi:predicted MFS family arabinose efflux permease
VPSARRGRALGVVMSGFAVASVFGVPLSLELARHGGWRAPFFAVAACGLLVSGGAIFSLPALRVHLNVTGQRSRIQDFLRDRTVACALCATFTLTFSAFCIVPNLSAYLQHNRGYPREQLSALYLVGGSVSFVVMRVVGRYVDKLGATRVASVGGALYVFILALTFVWEVPNLPIVVIFACFMAASAVRSVSLTTLSSRVPQPHERARFMSLQSAVQHVGAAAGSALGSLLLVELPDTTLRGMPFVASVSIAFGLVSPLLLAPVERRLRLRRPSLPPLWTIEAEVARSSIPPA